MMPQTTQNFTKKVLFVYISMITLYHNEYNDCDNDELYLVTLEAPMMSTL